MAKVCVINVVGLTPRLVEHAPNVQALGKAQAWKSPYPAVTWTSQATMLTGKAPREHGIVGNGWLFRDTCEVRMWQQANSLLESDSLYDRPNVASAFWWFTLGSNARWYVTPRPHYGSDGSKVLAILDRTGCDLETHFPSFPFQHYWGPMAGVESSEWISHAASRMIREKTPDLTMVYLPHLDYDFQRFGPTNMDRVREVDACAGKVIDAAKRIDARIVVVSEYGLVPVSKPVMINQFLRKRGWIEVREGPFGEMLMTHHSKVVAVADHQLAHLYVNGLDREQVREAVATVDGVHRVVDPEELELDHPRSGELIALAEEDAWFAYPYWLEDNNAPDFATSVDIHRKPGYDPCELFMTSRMRGAARLIQKKLGFRYRFDVIPLDPTLIKGSHGLRPLPEDGPVIIGDEPPDDMKNFRGWIEGMLG